MEKTLERMPEAKSMLCGVCSGIAYYAGVPSWLIRFIFLLLALMGCGIPVAAYIVFCIVLPRTDVVPEDFDEVTNG
jgi:phage shock protein PspC (stress-responsive transcriptional regulator)